MSRWLWYPVLNDTDPAGDLFLRIQRSLAQFKPPFFLIVYAAPNFVDMALDMRSRLPSNVVFVGAQDFGELARQAGVALGKCKSQDHVRRPGRPTSTSEGDATDRSE